MAERVIRLDETPRDVSCSKTFRKHYMRILTLLDYFEPGYKAGGPIRTISNMIARLGNEYTFRVVTRDRDLGSSEPYPGIAVNEWSRAGKAEVLYVSPAGHLGALVRLLREDAYDALYLNSFFSWKSTILPLALRRCGFARNVPVILAPRGEFSLGALGLKSTKKRLYIMLARVLGLCRRVTWQASSENEAKDIRRVMKVSSEHIMIAPNLLPDAGCGTGCSDQSARWSRPPRPLHIVFLSRISPMKNLDFLLRILRKVDTTLSLDIYGPTEDLPYWEACSRLIAELPVRTQVTYRGAVSAEEVINVFEQYDLFVFPTRGENFGHVIFESLTAGTPVLLSDRTPWRADSGGAVEVLRLDDEDAWSEAIARWGRVDRETLELRRQAARSYAQVVRASDEALVLNKQLFETCENVAKLKNTRQNCGIDGQNHGN